MDPARGPQREDPELSMRTTVQKALHQVKRGRRKITARQFNQDVRDRGPALCACIGSDCSRWGCWIMRGRP